MCRSWENSIDGSGTGYRGGVDDVCGQADISSCKYLDSGPGNKSRSSNGDRSSSRPRAPYRTNRSYRRGIYISKSRWRSGRQYGTLSIGVGDRHSDLPRRMGGGVTTDSSTGGSNIIDNTIASPKIHCRILMKACSSYANTGSSGQGPRSGCRKPPTTRIRIPDIGDRGRIPIGKKPPRNAGNVTVCVSELVTITSTSRRWCQSNPEGSITGYLSAGINLHIRTSIYSNIHRRPIKIRSRNDECRPSCGRASCGVDVCDGGSTSIEKTIEENIRLIIGIGNSYIHTFCHIPRRMGDSGASYFSAGRIDYHTTAGISSKIHRRSHQKIRPCYDDIGSPRHRAGRRSRRGRGIQGNIGYAGW